MTKLIYKPRYYNNIEFTEELIKMIEPKKYDCNQTAFTETTAKPSNEELWNAFKNSINFEEYQKALEQISLKERDTLMSGKWEPDHNTIPQESPMEFRKGMQVSTPTVSGYMYNGSIYRWIDGDTVEVVLDLGLKIAHRTIVRLYSLNAPEKNTEEGMKLIEQLNLTYPSNSKIIIQTIKDKKEKYGRYLANIWCNNTNINEYLLANNLAKILKY